MITSSEVTAIQSCNHINISAPRERRGDNGISHFRRQCLDCGRSVGNAIKREQAYNLSFQETQAWPISFDENLYNERINAVREYYDSRKIRNLDNQVYWADRRKWYREVYLLSPEWQAKRLKVFERCNNVCEGCRIYKASEVHHLTYDHVGDELLFELVGLCSICHDKVHHSVFEIDEDNG